MAVGRVCRSLTAVLRLLVVQLRRKSRVERCARAATVLTVLLGGYWLLAATAAPRERDPASASSRASPSDGGQTPTPPPAVLSGCLGIGRLGNAMFAYAGAYAAATRHGLAYAVSAESGALLAYVTLRSLFNLSDATRCGGDAKADRVVAEPGWSIYNAAVEDRSAFGRLTAVGCYLQSWRYFGDLEGALRSEFTIVAKYRRLADRFFRAYSAVNAESRLSTTFVAVHVRRGDMLLSSNYNVAPASYLHSACLYFQRKYQRDDNRLVFVVATDDFEWTQATMSGFRLLDGGAIAYTMGTAEEDMAILSSCHHAVITGGTFGWWAAWLTGGEVVYYRDFVLPQSDLWLGYRAGDYYPPDWIGLS